ncbi:hypothetical protein HYQ45_007534 [Verticillium longisporum]|uniref:Uncharacterized protein n=1 Tax=Verticillium longisporum TaxID=100787 RepID=A0A8I2ZP18_VERLO|nr:hypothetical protein HYQ45_007534 [Verticillium longisporum]
MLETTAAEDAERHAVDELLYVSMTAIRARATREDQTFDLLEPVDVNARDPRWIARRACCVRLANEFAAAWDRDHDDAASTAASSSRRTGQTPFDRLHLSGQWPGRRAQPLREEDPRYPGVGPHDHLYTQDSRDQEAVLDRVIAAQDRARNAERERRRLHGPNGYHHDEAGSSNGGYPFSDYCAW